MNGPAKSRLFSILFGFAAGAVICWIDNVASGGEVSPIVIVALLFGTTAVIGAVWRRLGLTGAWLCWAWVPMAHVVKHVLNLPDTLHPNTYRSIALLGAFSLGVAALGYGVGLVLARWSSRSTASD